MASVTKKKKEWKITANRFVAFLDILGFKNLVNTKKHDQILYKMRRVMEIVQQIETRNTENNKLKLTKSVIFSDSILIVSEDNTQASAKILLYDCTIIFNTCLREGLPIKGSIAAGRFTADYQNSIFFGQPLIDAYLLQEKLFAFGIIFHHTFDEKIDIRYDKNMNITYCKLKNWIFSSDKFLKIGSIRHNHLNWLQDELVWALDEGLQNGQFDEKSLNFALDHRRFYITNFYDQTSGESRKYVDNTIEVYNHLKGLFINSKFYKKVIALPKVSDEEWRDRAKKNLGLT